MRFCNTVFAIVSVLAVVRYSSANHDLNNISNGAALASGLDSKAEGARTYSVTWVCFLCDVTKLLGPLMSSAGLWGVDSNTGSRV